MHALDRRSDICRRIFLGCARVVLYCKSLLAFLADSIILTLGPSTSQGYRLIINMSSLLKGTATGHSEIHGGLDTQIELSRNVVSAGEYVLSLVLLFIDYLSQTSKWTTSAQNHL